MPILDVEIVDEVPPALREGLAARIADAAGEALASRRQGTWVRLRAVGAADYADSGGAAAGATPVFVRVLQYDLPEGDALAGEIARLTQAIAQACGRSPEHIHVMYEPPARGRIAFGGVLQR